MSWLVVFLLYILVGVEYSALCCDENVSPNDDVGQPCCSCKRMLFWPVYLFGGCIRELGGF